MTFSPKANRLRRAIDASDLTQRKVADRAGFHHANVISMIKSGEMMVPLERIPAPARTLGVDEQEFLSGSIAEYHPNVHAVLTDVMGLPLSDAELGILAMFRMATIRDEIKTVEPVRTALSALFDLASIAQKPPS